MLNSVQQLMSPVYVIVGIYKNINYIFLETIELYSFHRVLHLLGFVARAVAHCLCLCFIAAEDVISMADSTIAVQDIEGELCRIERIRDVLVRRESELRYM